MENPGKDKKLRFSFSLINHEIFNKMPQEKSTLPPQ